MQLSAERVRPEDYGNVAVTPWHVIERLHDEGVDAGLESNCERGVVIAWIRRKASGGRMERTFARDEFDLIAPWLEAAADSRSTTA